MKGVIHTHVLQRYDFLPVDYIKAEVINMNPDEIRNRANNRIHTVFKGEFVKKEYFIIHGLKIEIRGVKMYLSGSLHKFWNYGMHNWNDFKAVGFKEAINRLKNELGILPENLRITQMEYGLNIIIPLSCSDVINSCFYHNSIDFEQNMSNRFGKYHKAEHSQYIVKVYDKGLQYHTGTSLLRIEIKVKKWWEYKISKGIITLADFISTNKTPFVNDLLNRWNEILFVDPTTDFGEKWHKYTNRNFWALTRNKSREAFRKHRQRLIKLNSETGMNFQKRISFLLVKKLNELQFEKKQGLTFLHVDKVQKRQPFNIYKV